MEGLCRRGVGRRREREVRGNMASLSLLMDRSASLSTMAM